jgi:two-component system OmpR family response regulator
MASILIVEDDAAIADLLRDQLGRAGHRATRAASGDAAIAALEAQAYDLIILDVMLPGASGIEVCRSIRARPGAQPLVMMVTAKVSESDAVAGLDAGADEYVRKPFGIRELVARVEALVRMIRREEQPGERLRLGELAIDERARQVWVRDAEVALTRMEFDMLCYFARRPGEVLSRGTLLRAVWGYDHEGYARTVDSHVLRVRKKLGAAGLEHDLIQTVHAAGYRLMASVETDHGP